MGKEPVPEETPLEPGELSLEAQQALVIFGVLPDIIEGMNGVCAKTGEKEITIALCSRLPDYKLFTTLAHEMVHVKQFALGEMKDGISSAYTYWQGSQISEEDNDYWDLPWEIEAHGREKGLFTRFKHHYKLEGLYLRPTYGDK